MDDVRAVMDAAGSQAAILFGTYQGAAMSILFAATYPERVRALVLWAPTPRTAWAPDYEWGLRPKEFREAVESIETEWGGRAPARWWAEAIAPSRSQDESFVRRVGSFLRMSASPGAAAANFMMDWEIDVRHVLPSVSVPTLVLSRETDKGRSRYVAERIPRARYHELPGVDSLYVFDEDDVIDAIREFAERPHAVAASAVVATVLFTDIVRSTEIAAARGDAGWRDLLGQHHAIVRSQLARFRGVEIDTSDGFFARFDGPARAIRCACEIRTAVERLGISIRAGLHTGECELVDGKPAGLAVTIGARVAARAGDGEVLVSQTVKDLVAGSGLAFEDRGATELKGVPGEWHLYAVTSDVNASSSSTIIGPTA